MRKNIIFIIVLLVIVFLSGCGGKQPPDGNGIKYYDNAVALSDYKAQIRVLPGQKTWIEFFLTNQVEYDVNNVQVKFFNPSVFKITNLDCDDGTKTEDGCYFDKIQSLDAKKIRIVLGAPTKDEIGQIEESYKVQFSVKYDYNGESVCYFRILEKEKDSTKTKVQLTKSTGPIKFEIKPGFIIEQVIDDQKKTVSDWAIEGIPFTLEMTGENVGDLGSGYEYPDIAINSFVTSLTNVKVEENDVKNCNFIYDKDKNTLSKEGIIVSTKDIFRPLTCILTPREEFTEPEIQGMIMANYSYRYEFRKTEMISIGTKS